MSTRVISLLLGAAVACVTAVAACPAASATGIPQRADLRATLVALPGTTRVGGTVTYRARLENTAAVRAMEVFMTFDVADVDLLSVSAARVSCLASDVGEALVRIACSTRSLAGHSQATVEVVVRTRRLGTVRAGARASSSTHDPNTRNNAAETTTRVAAPDLVHAEGTRLVVGGQDLLQEFAIGAISGPNGGDAAGTFTLTSRLPDASVEELSGRVTCMSLAGTTAMIAVAIERSAGALTTMPTRAGLLYFIVSDNGYPGAGLDTMTLVTGIGDPWATKCFVPAATFATSVIEGGDITIIDSR